MQSLACVVVKKLHDCGFRVVRIRVDGFCRVGGGCVGLLSLAISRYEGKD